MRIRELVLEDVPFVPGQTAPQQSTSAGQAPGQTPGKEGQDVGKLTASISALQKQVADLQKAALQQATAQEAPAKNAPPPGEAGQAQAPKGTVAPAAQQQQQQPVAGQKPPLGQPQGVPMGQPPAVQPATAPAKPAPQQPAPGVSQPPSITNMKIKQAVAQNQSGGTK